MASREQIFFVPGFIQFYRLVGHFLEFPLLFSDFF